MHGNLWPGERRRRENQILVASDRITRKVLTKEKCMCLLRDKPPSHFFSYSCDLELLGTQQSSSALAC